LLLFFIFFGEKKSIFLSSSAAGLIGSSVPLIFKTLGIDPAITAGPLETALQDVTANGIYLAMCALIL